MIVYFIYINTHPHSATRGLASEIGSYTIRFSDSFRRKMFIIFTDIPISASLSTNMKQNRLPFESLL